MPFFEGKIELYQILLLLIIPLGTPILMFFVKRKLLWVSPIMALIIGLILTVLFFPSIFTDIFTNNDDTTTGYWLMLVLPAHFIISVIATAICYATSRFRKNRN